MTGTDALTQQVQQRLEELYPFSEKLRRSAAQSRAIPWRQNLARKMTLFTGHLVAEIRLGNNLNEPYAPRTQQQLFDEAFDRHQSSANAFGLAYKRLREGVNAPAEVHGIGPWNEQVEWMLHEEFPLLSKMLSMRGYFQYSQKLDRNYATYVYNLLHGLATQEYALCKAAEAYHPPEDFMNRENGLTWQQLDARLEALMALSRLCPPYRDMCQNYTYLLDHFTKAEWLKAA